MNCKVLNHSWFQERVRVGMQHVHRLICDNRTFYLPFVHF